MTPSKLRSIAGSYSKWADVRATIAGREMALIFTTLADLAERVEKLDKLMDAWDRCDNKPGDDPPAPCPSDCLHKKALEWLVDRMRGSENWGWAIRKACDIAGLPYPWSKSDE